MGLSSNQARFLTLTSRQIDLEHRVQQICQRRLRLSSELERISTDYNNQISNRKMFTFNTANSGITDLNSKNLNAIGYKVVNNTTNKLIGSEFMKKINQMSESEAIAAGYITIHDASELVSKVNADPAAKYMLMGDIDLTGQTFSSAVIGGTFSGTFDGNGYAVKNLSIDTQGAAVHEIGLFAFTSGATIQNLGIENANINASDSQYVGALVGYNNSNDIIDNCYSSGTVFGKSIVGGLVGSNETSSTIANSYSSADVTATLSFAGGIAGANCNGNVVIENSYSSGNINGGIYVGGIAGANRDDDATVKNCYSTSSLSGTGAVGGVVGRNNGSATAAVINSYSSNATITSTGTKGGVIGSNNLGYSSGCFYQNNLTTDPSGATNGINITGWDTNIWDLSGPLPTLKTDSSDSSYSSENIEEGLRSGKYSLVKEADQYTQSALSIDDEEYEKIDWRTAPEIADELYKADDTAAEDKYDRTVSEINAQDKKLQLEQSSIEVEYKAVTSEKEAVKKILDTNTQSSFKYFS